MIPLGLYPAEAEQVEGEEEKKYAFLPSGLLFAAKIADPREPGIRAELINASDAGHTMSEVAFGVHSGVFKARLGTASSFQMDLEGGIFSRFSLGQDKKLNNIDYRIGLPLTFAFRNWSAKLSYYHSSSHLGDNEIALTRRQPITFSREILQALLGYQYKRIRFYGGPGHLFNPIPDVARGLFQLGMDSRDLYDISRDVSLYFGTQATFRSEWDWNPDFSLNVGVSIYSANRKRGLDIGLEIYSGKTQRGQFFKEDEDYIALTVEFRP